MADCGAMAIRDASRLASGATGGRAAKVTAVAGGEAKVLLRRADDWGVVLADKMLASTGNGGYVAEDARGTHHKA